MKRILFFVSLVATLAILGVGCAAPGTVPGGPPVVQTVVVQQTGVPQVVTATAAPKATVEGGATALTVAATWGGGERDAFQKVLDAFTAKTNIPVVYESINTNMGGILRTRVAGGSPPDVVFESRPGEVIAFAEAGNLIPIETLVPKADLEAAFNAGYLDLANYDGKRYGFVFKADSKSTFWYKPPSFKELGVTEPKTLDELFVIADKYKAAGKTPFATGGKSGWPLTDYLENLIIRNTDAKTYNDLFVTHTAKWTDPAIKKSLTEFAKFFQPGYQAGDAQGVLGSTFVESVGLAFGPSPKSEMFYEGGFVGVIATTDTNKNLKPGEDINFFEFPASDANFGGVVGGGDVAIAFRDTPEVRAFMAFLVSKEAADVFATTNTISPNKQLDPTKFPSVLARNQFQQLSNAKTFVFDGSDLAPASLGGDFLFTELQKLVQNPADVDTVADELEKFASTAYTQ